MSGLGAGTGDWVILDRGRIDQYKMLRPGFLERLVAAYLSESAGYMSKLRTSVPVGDLDGVRIAAHTLKSASVNLGAMRVGEICKDMEAAALGQDAASLAGLLSALGVEYFEAEQALRGVLMEAKAAVA